MPTAFTDRSRQVPAGLPARVVFMRQVHGASVAYVTEPFDTPRPHPTSPDQRPGPPPTSPGHQPGPTVTSDGRPGRNASSADRRPGPATFVDRRPGPDATFIDRRPGLDAVFTDQPGLALGVAVADCAPVLVTAPGWVGAAHSGRTGTAAGVVPALVRAMVACGADLAEMSVVIGPNACGGCYEVPAEMRADVAAALPATWATTRRGTPALDIRAGIVAQLTDLGVTRIRHDDRCTIESPELCSYRRDRSRDCFAGFVWLP